MCHDVVNKFDSYERQLLQYAKSRKSDANQPEVVESFSQPLPFQDGYSPVQDEMVPDVEPIPIDGRSRTCI